MITLPGSDCRPGSSVDDVEPSLRQFFPFGSRAAWTRDEVEIILDRKIRPLFVDLLRDQSLFAHARVMPEDGCSIVKTEMVPIAGRPQPGRRSRVAVYSGLLTSTGGRGTSTEPLFDLADAWRLASCYVLATFPRAAPTHGAL
jgi:hypothetical protein